MLVGGAPATKASRLVAPDEGFGEDRESDEVARDAGIAGGAASAEEAAVHVIDSEEGPETEPAYDLTDFDEDADPDARPR